MCCISFTLLSGIKENDFVKKLTGRELWMFKLLINSFNLINLELRLKNSKKLGELGFNYIV